MKKAFVIIMFTATISFALDAELTGDEFVNFQDFAVFANAWKTNDANCDFNSDGTVDNIDLRTFASQWLVCEVNNPPSVNDISAYALRGTDVYFELEATDDGQPDPPAALTYRVLSLTAHGSLYDPNGTDPNHTDPNSQDPAVIQITSVPYTLVSGGHYVLYYSDAAYEGYTGFNYDANDGGSPPCGGAITGAVTITNNGPPTVADSNVSTYTYTTAAITLTATDNGLPDVPGKLNYIITSLPTDGNLQDPASGAGVIDSCDLPYTLSTWGNVVWFATDVNGADSFQWKANDGGTAPSGGDSNTVTVSITVDNHPKDFISFDGRGYLTVNDCNYLDVTTEFAVAFWIRTRDPFAGIMVKHGNANGLRIDLSSGKIKAYLYDANNNSSHVRTEGYIDDYNDTHTGRLNDGQWHFVHAIFEPNDTNNTTAVLLYIGTETVSYTDCYAGDTFDFISDMNNNSNLLIASNGNKYIRADIDRFCIYDSNSLSWDVANMYISGRTSTGYGLGGSPPVAEWRFEETSGSTATDSIHSLVATFNDPNHVRWVPFNYPFFDVSAQQSHRRQR